MLKRLSTDMPESLPPEHLVTSDSKPRERCTDEVRNDAEVLRDNFGAWLTKHAEDAFAERLLGLLRLRREPARAAVVRAIKRAVKPDEVIDAIAVEKVGVATRPIAKPVEVAFREHIPPIDRQSPVLARFAERIRRHAD